MSCKTHQRYEGKFPPWCPVWIDETRNGVEYCTDCWWFYFQTNTPDGYEIVETIDKVLNQATKRRQRGKKSN